MLFDRVYVPPLGAAGLLKILYQTYMKQSSEKNNFRKRKLNVHMKNSSCQSLKHTE